MNDLGWTPVEKGKIYCSPLCGSDCTRAEHDRAHAIGNMTLEKLINPKGWKVRVWENGGWHVQLQKGGMSLHISVDRKTGKIEYSTLLGRTKNEYGGNPDWTVIGSKGHFDCPNKAISAQLKIARKVLKGMNDNLAMFKDLE